MISEQASIKKIANIYQNHLTPFFLPERIAMYSDAVADAQYRQLYERFCQGDHRASIELVNLFGDRLLRYVRRSCIYDSYEAAEDCVQNTWAKLVQYCGKPVQDSSFWGFVCAIAKHQAIDDYRANTRQKRNPGEGMDYLEDDDQPVLADHDADPAKQFEAQEDERESQGRLQSFKQAVAGLPERQRLALTLQLAGYSLKSIAQHMQEKDETVKSHLRYAKNKLKRVLVETQGLDTVEA